MPSWREDGAGKNDCERNAAKRPLADLRREHPHLKLVVADPPVSNGSTVRLLQSFPPLKKEAAEFAILEAAHPEASLYGVTDAF